MLAIVFSFLQHLELAMRLHAAMPWLSPVDAYDHAVAASEAASDRVQPELLLAIAFIESRYDPTATSRVEGARRKTGRYPSTAAPATLDARASLYCGPLQTFAGSWHDCMALRDLAKAYTAGTAELETWLHDRRVHGSVFLALAGHGCGNFGVAKGHCNAYPERVLWIKDRLAPPARPRLVEARRPRS